MSTIRQVGSNTFYQALAKAINAVSGLTILTLLSRTLSDTNLGIYTLVFTYIGFFFMTVDLGFNAIVVKHLLQDRHAKAVIVSKVLGLRMLIAFVSIALAILLALLQANVFQITAYQPTTVRAIILIALVLFVHAIISTFQAVIQSIQNYLYLVLVNLSSALTHLLIIVLVLQFSSDITLLVFAYVVAGFIGAAVALFQINKLIGKTTFQFHPHYSRQLISETLPITLSILLNLVYFRIDALILPIFRSLPEVGKYNISYKIFENILILPTFIGNALYPIMLEWKQHSIAKLFHNIGKIFTSYFVVSILLTIIFYTCAPFIVYIVTGQFDYQMTIYLQVLITGIIFFFLSSLVTWLLITLDNQKALLFIYLVVFILTIILNIAFIPLYGAFASAVITVSLEALVFAMGIVYLLYYAHHYHSYRWRFPW
jgi:O-antigen/teichoic acid export membrane protein